MEKLCFEKLSLVKAMPFENLFVPVLFYPQGREYENQLFQQEQLLQITLYTIYYYINDCNIEVIVILLDEHSLQLLFICLCFESLSLKKYSQYFGIAWVQNIPYRTLFLQFMVNAITLNVHLL